MTGTPGLIMTDAIILFITCTLAGLVISFAVIAGVLPEISAIGVLKVKEKGMEV